MSKDLGPLNNDPDLTEAYQIMHEKLILSETSIIIQLVLKHACLFLIEGGKAHESNRRRSTSRSSKKNSNR